MPPVADRLCGPSNWPLLLSVPMSRVRLRACRLLVLAQFAAVKVSAALVTKLPPARPSCARSMPNLPLPTCRTVPPAFCSEPLSIDKFCEAVSRVPPVLFSRPLVTRVVVPC
ncbi:hypothetical protein FQZ97_1192640 [compost metagenome]